MNQKHKKSMYHANVNLNLMAENVIHIKSELMINVYMSVKNMIYMKKIIFGILVYAVAKKANIL